jgi:serine/threonine protein phosphatase 1
MVGRTFAIGDIHGELDELYRLLSAMPTLEAGDTLVFVGDYVDRGPKSAQTIDYIRRYLPNETMAKIVALRGNHEDAWLRVVSEGWPQFVLPPGNGCLATYRSFTKGDHPSLEDRPERHEYESLMTGAFWPMDVINWMHDLPYWYEDEHAIFVHAGLPKKKDGTWPHPSELTDPTPMLWLRTDDFFRNYRGKTVVFGHTTTEFLPQELSSFTPDDPSDLWAGENVIGIDTGCSRGGFLTAIEFPSMSVYESRSVAK